MFKFLFIIYSGYILHWVLYFRIFHYNEIDPNYVSVKEGYQFIKESINPLQYLAIGKEREMLFLYNEEKPPESQNIVISITTWNELQWVPVEKSVSYEMTCN